MYLGVQLEIGACPRVPFRKGSRKALILPHPVVAEYVIAARRIAINGSRGVQAAAKDFHHYRLIGTSSPDCASVGS